MVDINKQIRIKENEIFLILSKDGGFLFEGTFDHFRDTFFDNVSHENVVHFVKENEYTLYIRLPLE